MSNEYLINLEVSVQCCTKINWRDNSENFLEESHDGKCL